MFSNKTHQAIAIAIKRIKRIKQDRNKLQITNEVCQEFEI